MTECRIFSENSGLSRSPGIHHTNWSIGVYDRLIMWRRWYWLVPDALYMMSSICRSRHSSPPRYLDFMKSASQDNMTDPHIGRLVYKRTARADVLKGTRLPLGMKALLSAGTDKEGMRVQKTRRNDIILASQFYDLISDRVKVFSGSHPHHNPPPTLNRTW